MAQQSYGSDANTAKADIDPVGNFQVNNPVPPDFIPDDNKSGSYIYGNCSAKEDGNDVKCCECSFSVPMKTDGVSSWWKIREHKRNEHPILVPYITPLKDLQVKCIGPNKFQYGQATMIKLMELGEECYKCGVCSEIMRTKLPKKRCMDHIRKYHPKLARFNPYYQETPMLVTNNLFRYAGAYFKKQSDTKVVYQVCSFVSNSRDVKKSSVHHVRKRHAVLAPVVIYKSAKPNSGTTPQKQIKRDIPTPPEAFLNGNALNKVLPWVQKQSQIGVFDAPCPPL